MASSKLSMCRVYMLDDGVGGYQWQHPQLTFGKRLGVKRKVFINNLLLYAV